MTKEYWDLLDENRKKINVLHMRGKPIPKGLFHLALSIWVVNNAGEILIARRCFSKKICGGLWEPQTGSVLAGESSIDGALREVREEVGIELSREKGHIFCQWILNGDTHVDSWIFKHEFNLKNVRLQEGETIDAKKVTPVQLEKIIKNGEFIGLKNSDELRKLFRIICN